MHFVHKAIGPYIFRLPWGLKPNPTISLWLRTSVPSLLSVRMILSKPWRHFLSSPAVVREGERVPLPALIKSPFSLLLFLGLESSSPSPPPLPEEEDWRNAMTCIMLRFLYLPLSYLGRPPATVGLWLLPWSVWTTPLVQKWHFASSYRLESMSSWYARWWMWCPSRDKFSWPKVSMSILISLAVVRAFIFGQRTTCSTSGWKLK